MKHYILPLLLLLSTLLYSQVPRLQVPIGHTDVVSAVAFSPDGQTVLTGSWDGTAKLWDLAGRELQAFAANGWCSAVAFSPDGKTILTGSFNGTAQLWDLSGRKLQTFSDPVIVNAIYAVAFSPDGQRILTGSEDGTAKLWDISGQQLRTFNADGSAVLGLAFSPDGQQLLTGTLGGKALLWELSGEVVRSFADPASTAAINALAFFPDGQLVVTSDGGGKARLWDISGQQLQTFVPPSFVRSLAFSPNGKQLLTGTLNGEIMLWSLSGQLLKTFSGYSATDVIHAVAFSPAGKQILTGHEIKIAKLWQLSGAEVQVFTGHSNSVGGVDFSPDGKKILINGSGDSLSAAMLWDLSTMELQPFKGHRDVVTSAVFSPDGTQVLTRSDDGTARLWDLSGHELQTFTGYVTSAVFSPDGQQILTGTQDNTANLWDQSGQLLQVFNGHTDVVSSVAFSPNGRTVLTASNDKRIILWDLSGNALATYPGYTGDLYNPTAVFLPNGKQILTESLAKTSCLIRMLDISGVERQVFSGHGGLLYGASAPNGRQVLTRNLDGTASLWDLEGKEQRTFGESTKTVKKATYVPGRNQVVTVNQNNTMTIWDTQNGKELANLTFIDSTDWVVTTPLGLFDASPGAMKQMYYMVGLELIELDQLKERYYEPGLLQKNIGIDEGTVRDVSALQVVELYPEIRASIADTVLHIALTVRSGGLGQLSLFINGKEMAADINPGRATVLSVNLKDYDKFYLPGANTLALRAYNRANWLKSQAYKLTYTPPVASTRKGAGSSTLETLGTAKPHLYVIAVGTSDYNGRDLDLAFPDLEAAAMASAFQAAGSRLFEDRIHLKVLTTAAKTAGEMPSKANIAAAFATFAAQARPTDILTVYFSGHGLTYGSAEKSQFYYLTKDIASADLKDDEVRNNYTISSEDLTRWLTAIPARKQVMILDACNSGKVVESLAFLRARALSSSQIRAFDRMKDRTGMFILTGAAADKVSFEASQYGQGLLTFSLLKGMSGLALTNDKRVDVMTLFQYARDEVPVLAKGIRQVQVPVLAFPEGGSSFDIGIVDDQVKIPLAQVKPVFIRNNFQDEESFDDGLGLTRELAAYFQEVTARGAQAEVIYVDVNEYDDAYSIKGLYTINDADEVTIRGRLFKGAKVLGGFQVTGKKYAMPMLVEAIVDKVSGMMEK